MPTGNYRTVPIDSIFVNREKRQRSELVGIEELATSIAKVGLINKPVIQESGELVAGERRWTACKSLGWTSIQVQLVSDLSEIELQLIELEENIRRVDLPWQDQVKAFKLFHDLKKAEHDDWKTSDTASELGMSESAAQKWTAIATELEKGNERVLAAPGIGTALNVIKRDNARAKSAETALAAAVMGEAPAVPLLNADFSSWQQDYSGPLFNLIHCDFPYGINMQSADQGAALTYGAYADSPDIYWSLLDTLERAMDNVVSEQAHLIFWFSMDFYGPTVDRLTSMGWRVNPFPLIWHKSDNRGILPDPLRGPRRIYETALFASRGDALVVKPVSNVSSCPNYSKELHMNEKPPRMLEYFLSMFVDSTTSMLDPTCGSANAVAAAEFLGASRVLGLEINKEFYERSRNEYGNYSTRRIDDAI
jgi:ParB/RepB/Spo0J family partition protein